MDFILDALDVPPPGWHGRRGFIVRQLLRLVVELATFLFLLGSFLMLATFLWAGQITVAR